MLFVIVASFQLSSLPSCYVVVDASSSIVVLNAVEVVISVVISSHYCSAFSSFRCRFYPSCHLCLHFIFRLIFDVD